MFFTIAAIIISTAVTALLCFLIAKFWLFFEKTEWFNKQNRFVQLFAYPIFVIIIGLILIIMYSLIFGA